jgi:hypothetical protein
MRLVITTLSVFLSHSFLALALQWESSSSSLLQPWLLSYLMVVIVIGWYIGVYGQAGSKKQLASNPTLLWTFFFFFL